MKILNKRWLNFLRKLWIINRIIISVKHFLWNIDYCLQQYFRQVCNCKQRMSHTSPNPNHHIAHTRLELSISKQLEWNVRSFHWNRGYWSYNIWLRHTFYKSGHRKRKIYIINNSLLMRFDTKLWLLANQNPKHFLNSRSSKDSLHNQVLVLRVRDSDHCNGKSIDIDI